MGRSHLLAKPHALLTPPLFAQILAQTVANYRLAKEQGLTLVPPLPPYTRQAQTVANYRLAKEQGLTLVPLINKIDLPAAEPARVAQEVWNGDGGVYYGMRSPTRRCMLPRSPLPPLPIARCVTC